MSTPPPPAPGRPDDEPLEPMKIRTPEDVITAVPYLLGFHPRDSLVVAAFDGPRNFAAIRIDLPGPEPEPREFEVEAAITEILTRHRFAKAVLIGYGTEEGVLPCADRVHEALARAGVRVADCLRVDEGRWWSLTCVNSSCCPPEGKPYDASRSVVAATATYLGLAAAPSREALAEMIEADETVQQEIREATGRAERRLRHVWSADPRETPKETISEFVHRLGDLRARTRANENPISVEEIAEFSVLLGNLRLRDEAWVRIGEGDLNADIDLWTEVLRRTSPDFAAPPATLLAFAAYMAGNSGMARVALDRADEADPYYSLAALLHMMVSAAVPPSTLRKFVAQQNLDDAYDTPREPS
ncbi:DUF4192 domain-containing protein [Actinomadura oligospora]|uniref:DUF4192 domain-containing protein n=1 Tax=Actinomadura oligospora TaxID=111804 RepID=UPI0007E8D2BE|nr:DUF4192 domain-containing protein [Actinomadura oligospora]